MLAFVALAALATVASAAPTSCPILFDGRVQLFETAADFDLPSSKYDHQFVHGDSTRRPLALLAPLNAHVIL